MTMSPDVRERVSHLIEVDTLELPIDVDAKIAVDTTVKLHFRPFELKTFRIELVQ